MIPNLRQKLRMMTSYCHSNDINGDVDINNSIPRGDMGGNVIETKWGSHLVKKRICPLDTSYGCICISDILSIKLNHIVTIAGTKDAVFNLEDVIFLDTETTGLAGGAGTVAFLVGVGYYEKDSFIIEQHVMRDYDEELSMLHGISDILSRKKVLISFNGKSFDWPLLESRFIFNRVPIPELRDNHIDLLHPSRTIWKHRLESCSLTSLERFIIRYHRENDISGSEVPQIYFKYLQNREPDKMIKVLKHNTWDIMALSAFTVILSNMMAGPLENVEANALYGMGRMFHNRGIIKKAKDCYIECIKRCDDRIMTDEARKHLAFIYKSEKNYMEASKLWKYIAERKGNLRILPIIELAKYYEHVEKDVSVALYYTDKAVEIVRNRAKTNSLMLDDILHRRDRLLKKIKRSVDKCL